MDGQPHLANKKRALIGATNNDLANWSGMKNDLSKHIFGKFNNQHEPTLRLNRQECESIYKKMELRPHNFSKSLDETNTVVVEPALDAHPIWFFGLAEVSVMPVLQP